MRILTALAALVVATSPVPAIATDAQSTDASSVTAAAPAQAKAKKICRESGKKTGSRMGGGRKCHTADEWAEIDSGGKSVDVQRSQVGAISRTNR